MRFLLDTNVCIAALKGHKTVCENLEQLSPKDCAVSTITVLELLTGVFKCREPDRQLPKVQRFLSVLYILPFDDAAASSAANLRANLESNGTKIDPYDTLIAGHALTTNLTIVTHNTKEFSRVKNLTVQDWQTES